MTEDIDTADDAGNNNNSLLGDLQQQRQRQRIVIQEEEDDGDYQASKSDDGDIGTNNTAATSTMPDLPSNIIVSNQVPPELLVTNTPEQGDQYFEFLQDPYAGSPGSKYPTYHLPVEHEEGDRAMEIKLLSCRRPHMRGLHCAWISFFLAFTIWFAPAPLLKEIQDTLGLTKKQLWNSSITNDSAFICLSV